jgi:hypothetical protein
MVSLVPGFCAALTGRGSVQGGFPFAERLDSSTLDYSLESLLALDRFLDHLHVHAEDIEGQQYTNIVLAAGCYVGEVMRRLTGEKFRWVNYADYFPDHADLSHIPEGPGTAAVLVSADGESMRLPLNKIARYIGEGPENSTHFFVAAELPAPG